MAMEQDLEIGLSFKNELIPLALEYYLAVTKDAIQPDGISTQNDSNNINRMDTTEVIRYDESRYNYQMLNPKVLAEKKKNEILSMHEQNKSRCLQQ